MNLGIKTQKRERETFLLDFPFKGWFVHYAMCHILHAVTCQQYHPCRRDVSTKKG
jgi:hypothetical protein